MQETLIRSLGQEDPLEEEMATCSSILGWKIPPDRGAWWSTVHRVAESYMTERLNTHSRKAAYSVPGLQTAGSNPDSATSFLPNLGYLSHFSTTGR